MRRTLLLSLLFLIFLFITKLSAQSCFNVYAGNDTTISCLQPCLDLKARVPDIQTTDDYQVVQIPYTPYPFTNPTGVVFNPTYIDDRYSDVIKLPFTYCFYGQTYASCVVGTNGILTFDTTNKNTYNAYIIDRPIFYAGGTPNNAGPYYPPASIMGPYHDIDPENGDQPYNKKMEYIIDGTAPCRKFILNFYRIPYYGCNDSTNVTTQQMVLYEGTGIIDIFIENKPIACAGSTNGGNAILGLQNWTRDKQVSPAGRNFAVWSSVREAWRFVPNGGTSLLDSVVLYKNGIRVTRGTTINLGNGELEATFSPVCQPEDSMSYVVKAFYQQCDNPAVETEGSDTMIVYKTLNPIITTLTNALCNGGLGTITVTSPLGANVEYSIDGGVSWQLSPVFNVLAGNYTIQARVIASLCGGSANVVITEPPLLTAVTLATVATCVGNDGSIDITAGGGTPAYQYSIDNGVNYQPGNLFTNLPTGNYIVKVKDANDCITTVNETILLNDTMRLELGPDSTICLGKSIVLMPQTNATTDTFKWVPATWLNYDTAKNPVSTPLDTIRYILTAKWGICQRKDTITINVLHKPVAFAGNDTTICYKTNATLNGTAFNLSGTVNYTWAPPDSLNTPNAASTVARMDTTRQFTLTVTDNYGCSFSVMDSMWVFMKPVVPAFAGNDTIAMTGKPHQLFGSGGNTYLWSPAQPLDNPFFQNPKAILTNDTYFTLLVTDNIGCNATDGVFIKVYDGPEYYLPNAFTPNGDGLNDIFRPIPSGMKSTSYFRVYNRNGQLLFQTSQWMAGWDGKIKGKVADQGTFVWMIKGYDVNGKVVEQQGTVILLR